jgi:hypothetical protein
MYPSIADLLDERKIHEPRDFLTWPRGEKIIFLKQLRSAVSIREDNVLNDISGTLGLRLHFHVYRHPSKGWQNLPNPTFARKIAFFSAKSIISIPFDEIDPTEGEDLEALLALLCEIKPYLRAKLVEVVNFSNDIRGVQVQRFNAKNRLVAANFKLADLERQFEEPKYETQVINLYLPYFRNLSPSQVIDLRQQEQVLYRNLERALDDLLYGKNQIDSEASLLSTLRNVDQHVNDLENRFKAIQRAEGRKDIWTLIGFIGIGLTTAWIPPAAFVALFRLMECESVPRYLSRKLANDAYDVLNEDQYYLLWKLHHRESLFRWT